MTHRSALAPRTWASVLALAARSDLPATRQRVGMGAGLAGGILHDYHKKSEESAYQRRPQEGQR